MKASQRASILLSGALSALCAIAGGGCSSAGPRADVGEDLGVTEAPLKGSKVTVCFNTKTMDISPDDLDHFLSMKAYLGPCADYGDRTTLGGGYAQTYAQMNDDGSPWGLGVVLSEAALTNLRHDPPFDGFNCWDADNDGQINVTTYPYECVGGHHRDLYLPPAAAATPFKWVLLNWNPIGHDPQGIYSVPHFDFHFYTMDDVARAYIRPGPCGMLVNCDDFQRGITPVPPPYMPPDYADLGGVEARMGNHLVDLTSPEFQPGSSFTHTFIYGAYDGHVTFWEPMITLSFLKTNPDVCTPIKLAAAQETKGYYPSRYCIRRSASRHEITVSLEGFDWR